MPSLTHEAQQFAANLEKMLAESGEVRYQGMPSDGDSPFAYRQMGHAGMIGLHWPESLGGRGRTLSETAEVEEIFGYHWLPLSSYLLSVKSIGNVLMRSAPPALIERFIPAITAGELVFCQGFSEPEAGSDLASIRTRAVLDNDRFIVNGRKMWTSSAGHADWVYLAVRTDPEAHRHRGLSVLVVDMKSPGIEIVLHTTLGGGTLGELVFDDVEVPRHQLIGQLHGGWAVLMGTMDYERVTSEKIGIAKRLLDELEPHATTPAHRHSLRELRGQWQAARLLSDRATDLLENQRDASGAAAMCKLAGANLLQRIAAVAGDLLGPAAMLEAGHPAAPAEGRIAAFRRAVVAASIAGGASDIQRRIIARRNLDAR